VLRLATTGTSRKVAFGSTHADVHRQQPIGASALSGTVTQWVLVAFVAPPVDRCIRDR
jgi:hypothetical protein